MSAALVRKSLALIDDDFQNKSVKKNENVFSLMPENQKLVRRIRSEGKKGRRVEALKQDKKLTVVEAKKLRKSKEERIKDNLRKLKVIKQVCTIELDHKVSSQIIERAVTRRPVSIKQQSKKKQTTAFTEEDFKKFEEEYFGD